MGRKPWNNTSLWIGWVFMAAGLAALVVAGFMLAAAWQSLSWPTVQGSISSHRVINGPGRGTTYGVRVTYSYWVDRRLRWGDVYSHSSDNLPGTYRRREEALEAYASASHLQPWQRGQPVTVYYDPQDPNDSVLQPGSTFSGWCAAAYGLVFLGVGLYEMARFKRLTSASGNGSLARPG